MDLPCAIYRWERRMELHRDRRYGFLLIDLLLQSLAPGARSYRPPEYTLQDFELLHSQVKIYHRYRDLEKPERKTLIQRIFDGDNMVVTLKYTHACGEQ